MRTQQNRRYIFIDFENLKKVKFRKLEKVCTRIFILIDAEEKNIPFSLVRQIQKIGKAVKWIGVEKPFQNDEIRVVVNRAAKYRMVLIENKEHVKKLMEGAMKERAVNLAGTLNLGQVGWLLKSAPVTCEMLRR